MARKSVRKVSRKARQSRRMATENYIATLNDSPRSEARRTTQIRRAQELFRSLFQCQYDYVSVESGANYFRMHFHGKELLLPVEAEVKGPDSVRFHFIYPSRTSFTPVEFTDTHGLQAARKQYDAWKATVPHWQND